MKKFNVILDQAAEDDLFEIYTYIALNNSEERADMIFKSLRDTCYLLSSQPQRGHIPPELLEIGRVEFKEIHCKPYRIFYSIEKSTVQIHCILDGRRDIQSILQERVLRD
ncbi:MAG: type II toxin-antitoxin system RelE/ParE family toxin [Deltaproteobacteria bacterium]|nr:type II toxin-antitoxin system RelE/ParE family toxin [Deltaproteobacteria bacterium]